MNLLLCLRLAGCPTSPQVGHPGGHLNTNRRARGGMWPKLLYQSPARRQLVLLVPCCLLANRAMKREIADHSRRKGSLQRIDEPDLAIHPSGVLRLIDTRCSSHSGHYVNGPARELHRQRAKGARAVADQINLRCKSKSAAGRQLFVRRTTRSGKTVYLSCPRNASFVAGSTPVSAE